MTTCLELFFAACCISSLVLDTLEHLTQVLHTLTPLMHLSRHSLLLLLQTFPAHMRHGSKALDMWCRTRYVHVLSTR